MIHLGLGEDGGRGCFVSQEKRGHFDGFLLLLVRGYWAEEGRKMTVFVGL